LKVGKSSIKVFVHSAENNVICIRQNKEEKGETKA